MAATVASAAAALALMEVEEEATVVASTPEQDVAGMVPRSSSFSEAYRSFTEYVSRHQLPEEQVAPLVQLMVGLNEAHRAKLLKEAFADGTAAAAAPSEPAAGVTVEPTATTTNANGAASVTTSGPAAPGVPTIPCGKSSSSV